MLYIIAGTRHQAHVVQTDRSEDVERLEAIASCTFERKRATTIHQDRWKTK